MRSNRVYLRELVVRFDLISDFDDRTSFKKLNFIIMTTRSIKAFVLMILKCFYRGNFYHRDDIRQIICRRCRSILNFFIRTNYQGPNICKLVVVGLKPVTTCFFFYFSHYDLTALYL